MIQSRLWQPTVAMDGEDHRQPLTRVRAQVRTILNPIDKIRGFLRRRRTGNPRICVTISQSKDLRLAFLDYEIGGDSALTVFLERYCRAERQARVLRLKNCATRTQRGFMSGASIIESRTAHERNAHRAPHTANPA